MVETIRFVRRKLPHWLVADRPYFVTLRLAGTLPKSVVMELVAERRELEDHADRNEAAWTDLHRRQFARIEAILDACAGNQKWLSNETIAAGVLDNLAWLEDKRGWRLYAATVMPNHLHLLMRNVEGRSGQLLEDLAHYKSFTGQMANRALGRSGRFWAKEDFDHWCRTPDKVVSVARYICNNPVKAGLIQRWSDWPWTRCHEDFRAEVGGEDEPCG